MGWAVSYKLVRAAPLSDDERAAVAAHAARFVGHPWPIEPYAPIVGDGAVVVAGVTKMPWSTTTPAWGWLLAALTELRTLVAGARCEVSDDHEAVTWSEASQRYAVPPLTIAQPRAPRPRAPRAPRPPGASGGARFRCVRVEPHQRHGHVVIRDQDVLRFELRGTRARLEAGLFVRTAIAASIDHAAARLLAADGAELAVVERARWSGFELAPEVSARLAMMELVARTFTPCDGFPVARLAVGALDADGAVTLTPVDGWPAIPTARSRCFAERLLPDAGASWGKLRTPNRERQHPAGLRRKWLLPVIGRYTSRKIRRHRDPPRAQATGQQLPIGLRLETGDQRFQRVVTSRNLTEDEHTMERGITDSLVLSRSQRHVEERPDYTRITLGLRESVRGRFTDLRVLITSQHGQRCWHMRLEFPVESQHPYSGSAQAGVLIREKRFDARSQLNPTRLTSLDQEIKAILRVQRK